MRREKATKWTVCYPNKLYVNHFRTHSVYINTITAFALRSRSLCVSVYIRAGCRGCERICQEFCVSTNLTWIENTVHEIYTQLYIYISMPEQGYYNVSNVQSGRRVFFCTGTKRTEWKKNNNTNINILQVEKNERKREWFSVYTTHIACIHTQPHAHMHTPLS